MLPGAIVGVLLLFGMGLLVFLGPAGRGVPQVAVSRSSWWYAVLTRSDNRWMAGLGQTIGTGHRAAVTVWRRAGATAAWLLGR